MCGITGIIGQNFDHRNLDAMMTRIAHRGPDGQGRWTNGAVSFGHLRLKIIDLSERAAQPMTCPATGNVLVFNGEIYNYLELKSALATSYDFRSDSDSEVLLAAYAKWGIGFLQCLRGMFAFALFDARRRKVLLARDRLGIKPLYYRSESGCCLFSSEIKGLVNLARLPQSVRPESVLKFLSFRQLDTDEHTFFNEVRQIPAASWVWVSERGEMADFQRYWTVPNVGDEPFSEEKKSEFREKLTETLRFHLRSDVPVGSFLSGGLDSSSIACLTRDLLKNAYPMQTFSSILSEKTEENALIPLLQKHLHDCRHNEVQLDGVGFLDELPGVIFHHDEPLPDASMYAHYRLCALARQQGVKVLLSGNGGDEVLGGYAAHIYALLGRNLKRGQITRLLRNIRRYSAQRPESRWHLTFRALQEAAPFALRNFLKQKEAARQNALLQPGFADEHLNCYPNRDGDPWQANYANNLTAWTVPPFLHYEDRNSMAFGVEIRVPMLDHVFVEYMARFSPEALVQGRSKNVLRSSLRGLVPEAVLSQKGKYGFPAPLEQFVTRDPAKARIFFKEHVRQVPFFNQKTVAALAKEVLDEGDFSSFHFFWRVLSVAVWYNVFFSKQQVFSSFETSKKLVAHG